MRRPISGHVFRREGKRQPVWYAKYRLPDGREVQRKIGPAWTDRGRPAAGYFTKRTAEDWLRDVLDKARAGTLPGLVRTGSTFAAAAEEWLRYSEQDRAVKSSTMKDYRSTARRLNEVFGARQIEDITTRDIEGWKAGRRHVSNRTVQKELVILNGIFKRAKRVHGLPLNPVDDVERPRLRKRAGIDVLSPEEVAALARAAENEQDAALFMVAAYTGLRQGELLGLRWQDVDFANATLRVERSFTHGEEGTPKSGRARAVPLVPQAAEALARLGQRPHFTGDRDLVFCHLDLGTHLDASKLVRRFKVALKKAELRELRFHDLRHTFGSLAIRVADPRELMAWMGHADLQTTQQYLAYKPRTDTAERLAQAFNVDEPELQADLAVRVAR